MGMVKPVLGSVHRYLCEVVLDGSVGGFEDCIRERCMLHAARCVQRVAHSAQRAACSAHRKHYV